eukprot:2969485-Pyramimonas_sp.AAC.1
MAEASGSLASLWACHMGAPRAAAQLAWGGAPRASFGQGGVPGVPGVGGQCGAVWRRGFGPYLIELLITQVVIAQRARALLMG